MVIRRDDQELRSPGLTSEPSVHRRTVASRFGHSEVDAARSTKWSRLPLNRSRRLAESEQLNPRLKCSGAEDCPPSIDRKLSEVNTGTGRINEYS